MYSPTFFRVSVLSYDLILSLRIRCHAVFIFAHGGFGGIFRIEDNVAMDLLDGVGESRCTHSLTFFCRGGTLGFPGCIHATIKKIS